MRKMFEKFEIEMVEEALKLSHDYLQDIKFEECVACQGILERMRNSRQVLSTDEVRS